MLYCSYQTLWRTTPLLYEQLEVARHPELCTVYVVTTFTGPGADLFI